MIIQTHLDGGDLVDLLLVVLEAHGQLLVEGGNKVLEAAGQGVIQPPGAQANGTNHLRRHTVQITRRKLRKSLKSVNFLYYEFLHI